MLLKRLCTDPPFHIIEGQPKQGRKTLILNCMCICGEKIHNPNFVSAELLSNYWGTWSIKRLLSSWLTWSQCILYVKMSFEGFTASHGPFWKVIFFTFRAGFSSQPPSPPATIFQITACQIRGGGNRNRTLCLGEQGCSCTASLALSQAPQFPGS